MYMKTPAANGTRKGTACSAALPIRSEKMYCGFREIRLILVKLRNQIRARNVYENTCCEWHKERNGLLCRAPNHKRNRRSRNCRERHKEIKHDCLCARKAAVQEHSKIPYLLWDFVE